MATASVAVRLNAITGEFETAFKGATRTVAGFEKAFSGAASSIKGHQEGINRAFAALSGDKLIAESNQLAAAVARVGGASKLTEAEQRRVNAAVTEAIAKYKALGQDAPASLQALERATRQVAAVTQPATLASKAMGALSGTFAQFTAANLAATAISNVVGKMGEFVAAGAKLPALEQSFNKLAKTVGQDSQAMLSALQTGTRGLVSNLDLMQSANKAILLGLPVTSKEMGELAKTATILGRAMGQDATSSLNDLITALGRSSPLILDNLGLTVKVGEANEAYAKKIGKTVSQLTDAESKMAFYEAAMEAARKKTQEIGEQTKTLGDIVDTVWTSIGNNVTAASGVINQQVGKILTQRSSLVEFLKLLALTTPGQALVAMQTRDQNVGGSRAKPDTVLPSSSEQQIQALRESAKKLAADALIPLSAAQKELTKDFAAGGKGASDIKKELDKYAATAGASEVQISKFLDAQKKAGKAGDDYTDVLKRIAAAQIPLSRQQIAEVDRLLKLGISHGDIAKALRVSEVAVGSYADAQKKANDIIRDLEKTVASAGGELGKLPGRLVPITKAFTELNTLLPAVSLKVHELFGPDGLGKSVDVQGFNSQNLLPDAAIKEFESRMDVLRGKITDVTNVMRQVGDVFGGVAGLVINHAASMVQAIGAVKTATDDWSRSIANVQVGLIALDLIGKAFYEIQGKADAAAVIVDDFIRTFADANVVLYENGRRLRTVGEGGVFLQEQLKALGDEGVRLWEKLKGANNSKQALAAIQAIHDALARTPTGLAEAAGFQTIEQLKAIAADAVKTFEYMRDSGLYTAEAVQQAWERAQAALVKSGDASAVAADHATAAISKLKGELQSLTASVADEAPEEVMGVIESQARAKIAAIEAEIAKEEEKASAAEAAIKAEADYRLQTGQETDRQLREIFGDPIHVPIIFDYEVPEFDDLVRRPRGGIPGFSTGAYVRRPTLALIGERGPEYVTPAAQMDAIRSQGAAGKATNNYSFVVNGDVDSEDRGRKVAEYFAQAVRRGGRTRTLVMESLGMR